MKINQPILTASFFGVAIIGGSLAMVYFKDSTNKADFSFGVENSDQEKGDGARDFPQQAPWLQSGETGNATATKNLPDTHTAKLAASTLNNLLNDQTGDKVGAVRRESASYIQDLATDELYTKEDINLVEENNRVSLRAYGNRIAMIVSSNAVPEDTKSEVDIVAEAMNTQNPDVLNKLDPIILSYEGMAKDMREISVPSRLEEEHLALLNSYQAIANDISGMKEVMKDPVYALVRIRRYETDALSMYAAISDIYNTLDQEGIKWTDSDPASNFIRINSSS